MRNTLVAEAVGCKLMLDHVKTVEMYIDSLVQNFVRWPVRDITIFFFAEVIAR